MGGIPAKMYKLMNIGNRNLLQEHPSDNKAEITED